MSPWQLAAGVVLIAWLAIWVVDRLIRPLEDDEQEPRKED